MGFHNLVQFLNDLPCWENYTGARSGFSDRILSNARARRTKSAGTCTSPATPATAFEPYPRRHLARDVSEYLQQDRRSGSEPYNSSQFEGRCLRDGGWLEKRRGMAA